MRAADGATFTLSDLTTCCRNANNTFSDTIAFDPANEFHTGGTGPLGAPPSHVRYNIVSNDNKKILPDGSEVPPAGTPIPLSLYSVYQASNFARQTFDINIC
jgi:hypothetical protein